MEIYQMHEEHGRTVAYTRLEAKQNEKDDWKTVPKEKFYAESNLIGLKRRYIQEFGKHPEGLNAKTIQEALDKLDDSKPSALVEAYVEKFGKKPHHKLSDENIKKALED